MKDKFLKYLIIIAGTALGLFLFPFALKVLAPFLIAFGVACPCQRIIRLLDRRFGINRGISSAAVSTLIVVLVLAGAVMLVITLFGQIKNFAGELPEIVTRVNFLFQKAVYAFDSIRRDMPGEMIGFLDGLMQNATDYASSLSRQATDFALTSAADFAAALPGALVFVVTLIISVFFFVKDYPLVINFLKEIIPLKWQEKISRAGNFFGRAFSSYFKAQLYLMLITAALITVGLWVAGLGNPLLWGMVCALVDALPFLGTAVILVPWAVGAFLLGDIYTFSVLIIIQVIVFVVRQLAEPRVVSRQIGLHPILTLVSVYAGLKLFGVAGVLFAPVVTVFGANVYVAWRESRP